MEMENKEIEKEVMVDYIAKERAERICGNSILNACFVWGIAISYMAYTFYSITTALNLEQPSDGTFCVFFIMLFFTLAVPVAFLIALFPYEGIGKEIQAARRFLLESGQEASRENINILVNKFYKESWVRIEDMLYDNSKAILAENMEFISGNEKVFEIPRKGYENEKIMIGGDMQ